jgi:hypothetical protein
MDRNWIIDAVKFTPMYLRGVADFMNFARQHGKESEPMLCRCTECLNLFGHNENTIEGHIICNSMSLHYKRWIFYGESFSDDEGDEGVYQSDDDYNSEEVTENSDDVQNMLHDLEESGDRGPTKPNMYAKLIEEAN